MVPNVHRNHKAYWGRGGGGGGNEGTDVGKRVRLDTLSLQCHHMNDSCIRMDSEWE